MPAPQEDEAEKTLTLAQAKSWFTRHKSRLISQKSSTDSLLALKQPDWNRFQIYNHVSNNSDEAGMYLEMPLTYNGLHQFTRQTTENGTKSKGYTKLVLKKISETEFLPLILRVYADSTYLTQPRQPLYQNNCFSFDANFTGEAHFFNYADERFIMANKFSQGKLIASTAVPLDVPQKKVLNCITVVQSVSYALVSDSGGAQGGNLDPQAADPPQGSSVTTTTQTVVTTTTHCWRTTPQSSTTPGGASGYAGGGGKVVNPFQIPPYEFSDVFKKIVDISRTTKSAEIQMIDEEIQRLYKESCLFKCIVDKLSNTDDPDDNSTPRKKLRLKFEVTPNVPGAGKYYPYEKGIAIKTKYVAAYSLSNILSEELFHCYQDIFDAGSYRDIPPDGYGVPNIEFESKIFSDIDNLCYNKANIANPNKRLYFKPKWGNMNKDSEVYEKYLNAITQNGTAKPTSLSAFNPAGFSYQTQLANFKEAAIGTPYYKTINTSKSPDALIKLISTCNCN